MEFIYDVAFSFCKEDLSYAYEIKNHLSSSIRSFIYADKQELLVGKDGPAKFATVFRKEARLVVILYRRYYGNTQYTTVEKNAIATRALENNWNFVLLLPFEKPVPDWYPYTYIYLDPLIHRPDQIASAIEYKLREMGAVFLEDTLDEKVAKLKSENDFKKEREKYLNSSEAFQRCKELFDLFWKFLQEKCLSYSELIDIRFVKNNEVRFKNYRQTFEFHMVNSKAKDSYLFVAIEKGTFNYLETKLISKQEIKFDINESMILGWSYENNIIDSEILVAKVIEKLIELQ